MKRRVTILIIVAAVLAALLIWIFWANKALVTSVIEVRSETLPEEFEGFRIAQVSDLHNTEFGEGNAKLFSLLREAGPDIIVVTGDLIDSRHTDVDAAVRFIEGACEIAPVYYVTGNHESRLDFDSIAPRLSEAGAVLLRSEAAYIERDGERIMLAGIDDPAFVRTGGDALERAGQELAQLPEPEEFTVLLAHRPDLIATYAWYGPALVLSGHAHGGQVRLPLIGALYAPGQGFFPDYTAGLYEVGDTQMIVSRGLGNSLIPLRFNNRPELVLALLRGA